MDEPIADADLIGRTASIVSAYVSNNRIEAGALAGMIAAVRGALAGLAGGGSATCAAAAGGPDQEEYHAGLPGQPGGRESLQVAATASADEVRHDAARVSRQVGANGGLSDGGGGLRQGPLGMAKAAGLGRGKRESAAGRARKPAAK